MATPVGTVTTYQLTTGIKLDIEDMIYLISPFDTPLIGGFGADGLSHLSSKPAFEKMVQWLDETLLTPRTTLASTANTADTAIYVAAGTGINFQTGDLLLLQTGEYVQVAGAGATVDTLSVVRAFSGTAALQPVATPVVGTGMTLPEGTDAQAATAIDRANRYNMTQIFGPRTIQVSGSENSVQKYGLTGTEFDHQAANRVKEIGIAMEQTVLYGVRTENPTAGVRSMGGMFYYITANVDSATTVITEAALLTQLQNCYNAGGSPDRILVGPKQKQNLSAINASQIRYTETTNVRGERVDTYISDFGTQSLILERWARNSEMFIFSREQAVLSTLRPLQFEALAKTGDSTKGMIVAEKTLEFHMQSHAAMFTALT